MGRQAHKHSTFRPTQSSYSQSSYLHHILHWRSHGSAHANPTSTTVGLRIGKNSKFFGGGAANPLTVSLLSNQCSVLLGKRVCQSCRDCILCTWTPLGDFGSRPAVPSLPTNPAILTDFQNSLNHRTLEQYICSRRRSVIDVIALHYTTL